MGCTVRVHAMQADDGRDLIPYQWLFRAMGAALDEVRASSVSIIETGEGFVVRYRRTDQQPELAAASLSYAALLEQRAELESRRVVPRRVRAWEQGEGAHSHYQDMLRAMGSQLERIEAYSILVDEIDEGLIVTYQYLDARDNYLFRKAKVMVRWDQVSQMLGEARSRRTARSGRR